MVRPTRRATVTCPSCGRETDRAPHYCESCGYDYWRAAPPDATSAPVATPTPTSGRGAASRLLVWTGVAGLTLAGGIAFLSFGGPSAVVALVRDAFSSPPPEVAITRPSRGPEDVIVSRFFRQVRSEFASFRMVSTVELRTVNPPGAAEAFNETFLVDGADWGSYVTYTPDISDPSTTEESWLVEVDGVARGRDGADGEWYPVELTDGSANPFARISTVNEVEYVDEEIVQGASLHHLLVTKWVGLTTDDLRFLGYGTLSDRENEFHIWVDDEGVPVRARLTATFGIFRDGAEVTLAQESEITFHDWGEIDSIDFPEPGEHEGPAADARYNPASHASARRGADTPHVHDRTQAAPTALQAQIGDQRSTG